MLALESTAFYGGSFNIGTLDDGENFDDSAVYDERNKIYLVGKKEIPMDYFFTITSAKGKQYVDNGRFANQFILLMQNYIIQVNM